MTARSPLAGRRSAALRQPLIRIPSVGKIEEKAVKTHLLCAMALGLAATATAASAQDSESFIVQTSVAPFCANLAAAPTPLALGELIDADGFVVSAFAGTSSHSVASYYCNAPATVTLAAAPLMQTDGVAIVDVESFTDRVDYDASLVWDNVTGSVNSAAAPASIASTEANTGALTITVSNPSVDGTVRPIAGEYAGAVTLTIALN